MLTLITSNAAESPDLKGGPESKSKIFSTDSNDLTIKMETPIGNKMEVSTGNKAEASTGNKAEILITSKTEVSTHKTIRDNRHIEYEKSIRKYDEIEDEINKLKDKLKHQQCIINNNKFLYYNPYVVALEIYFSEDAIVRLSLDYLIDKFCLECLDIFIGDYCFHHLPSNKTLSYTIKGHCKIIQLYFFSNPSKKPLSGSSKAIEQSSGSSKAIEQSSGSSKAIEQSSGSSKAIEQSSGSSKAIEQSSGSSKAIEQSSGSSKAIEQSSGSSKAIETKFWI